MSHDTSIITGDDDDIVLITAVVGGVVSGALLLTAILLCVCLCIRRLRSRQVDLSKRDREIRKDVELGQVRPRMEPQIGSDHYRAVCPYKPKDTGSGMEYCMSPDHYMMVM